MITAYVIDDEPLALKRLCGMLDRTNRVQILGRTTRPAEALSFLSANLVDVLFLDVEMPGMNGFELVEKLEPQPLIVFTTAYDRYALRAFEVNSIDYLVKPIETDALERAITKLERLRATARPVLPTSLQELKASLAGPSYPDRLPSRVGGAVQLVEVATVTHFYARDKLTYAATPGKVFVIDGSLAQLEAKLDPRQFVRIHRATLVNLSFVEALEGWFATGVRVRLKDGRGTGLEVARDRVPTLKERLGL